MSTDPPADRETSIAPSELAEVPALSDALESDRFRRFLDHVPFGVAVAQLKPHELIFYANPEFERLTGKSSSSLEGSAWDALSSLRSRSSGTGLGEAIVGTTDYLGVFLDDSRATEIDAWSNVIQDDNGAETFRLVALSQVTTRPSAEDRAEVERQMLEKDTQLRELQHRVKNNLQMITALIRLEARSLPDQAAVARFHNLAGRIEALAILYRFLSAEGATETVDLGVYLSQIASAVMTAQAVEGIHLNMEVDTWPVAIDVAMPTGLVVNEVMTNSLKHAFPTSGGTVTLKCVVDEEGCHLFIGDDGVGLPAGRQWPAPGKMSALIVQSLRENAKARVDIVSEPGHGLSVSIFFARRNAIPAVSE